MRLDVICDIGLLDVVGLFCRTQIDTTVKQLLDDLATRPVVFVLAHSYMCSLRYWLM